MLTVKLALVRFYSILLQCVKMSFPSCSFPPHNETINNLRYGGKYIVVEMFMVIKKTKLNFRFLN